MLLVLVLDLVFKDKIAVLVLVLVLGGEVRVLVLDEKSLVLSLCSVLF